MIDHTIIVEDAVTTYQLPQVYDLLRTWLKYSGDLDLAEFEVFLHDFAQLQAKYDPQIAMAFDDGDDDV